MSVKKIKDTHECRLCLVHSTLEECALFILSFSPDIHTGHDTEMRYRKFIFSAVLLFLLLVFLIINYWINDNIFPNLAFIFVISPIYWTLSRINVSLKRGLDSDANAHISLRFVISIFLIFYFKDLNVLYIFLISSLIDVGKNKKNIEKHIYNTIFVCICLLTSLILSRSLFIFEDNLAINVVISTFIVSMVYHLVNITLVSTAISVFSRSPFPSTFRYLYQTAPGYLAGAAVVAAARIVLVLSNNNLWILVPTLALAAPMAFVILREQRYRRERDEEHSQRIQEKEAYINELEEKKSELQHRQTEIEEMYAATVEAFALAIDAKDRYTQEHIQRVKQLAVAIASEMGLRGDELRAIEVGAALHDIGKIAIPEHILNKPGRLTAEEFNLIKRHAEMGARILQPVHFPYPVMGVVRSHHEKWDGSGYPDGLRGDDIPLGGRILAVADVYDALTSDRPYRQGWSHERAAEYLVKEAGTHFDPAVVDAFTRVVAQDPTLCADSTPLHLDTVAIASDINRASFEYLAVYEVSQMLSVANDVGRTTQDLAARLRALYKADTCLILIADRSGLTVSAVSGANAGYFRGARADQGSGCTAIAFAREQSYTGPYETSDLLLTAATDTWKPIRSCMVAPLRSERGGVLGTINLYQEQENAFHPEDLRILDAVAALAARGIENAREFELNRESAFTDALTGLYNVRYLNHALAQEIARSQEQKVPFTVLMLDLDHFKEINDRFGHARGNDVLRDLGALFQKCLRAEDLLTRYAGDEFAVVLPATTTADATPTIAALRAAVGGYASLGEMESGTPRLSVSIGAATFPDDGADTEALLAHADDAMYTDKGRRTPGKGRARLRSAA